METVPGPSSHQQSILEVLSRPGPHVVVRATAGAGKTTLLVQLARAQPADTRQLFLAFARDAAAELRNRLPAGVETRTVHSLGRLVLQGSLARAGVVLGPPRPGKYRELARTVLQEQLPELADRETAHFVQELAGAVRLRLGSPGDGAYLHELVTEAALWPPVDRGMLDRLFSLLPTVLERGLAEAERGSIDFTDMLYVPVMKQLPVPVFDLVSIDEAQDYSAAALEFTVRLAAAGARLVFVGDPRQSIFGFAGAAPRALERTAERLSAAVLPLSVTYRCPRLHVELARQLAPELEVPATAPGGRVVVLAERELPAWVRAGDLIICRLNAPLVGLCLRLLTRGHQAFVKGVDLQARLQALAGRVFRHGFRQPQQQLRKFLAAELARFGEDGAPAAGAAADRLRDECACLQHFLAAGAGCPDRAALSALIEAAFAGDERSVVLSSIHRAKGMEADRVVLLQPELLPAPYARSGSALEAEACVQFVALTRARRELVFTEPDHVRVMDAQPAHSGGVLSVPPADRRAEVIAVWQSILLRARSGRRYRTQHGNRAAGRRNRTRLFSS